MRYSTLISALIVLLLVGAAASLMIGSVPLTFAQVWHGLMTDGYDKAALIFMEMRLPRTLLALLVGAALGMTGALLQGWLRNPLADPSLLGTTACASLGAVVAIHTGIYASFALALPLAGMAGSFIGMLLILVLAGGRVSLLTVILAGIALQSLAGSLTALALNLAPNPHTALEIAFWLLGSVSDRSNDDVLLALPFIIVGAILALRCRLALDALSFGEDTAASLGVNLRKLQWRIMAATALIVGPATAVTGAIGFVGLVIPHLLRPIIGAQPGRLLIPSAMAGALLLLVSDILLRVLPTSAELKLGVITSLIGAPFFIILLLRYRGKLL